MCDMEGRVPGVFKAHRRCDKVRGQQLAYTHVFGNGGMFVVPPDEDVESAIYDAMRHDADMGVPYFVAEVPSRVFNMFLDMNLRHHDPLSDDDVAELVREVNACLARFFPHTATTHQPRFFECIVTQADGESLCRTRPEFIKLMQPKPMFDETHTIHVLGGQVKAPHDARFADVEWSDGAVAQDGWYECAVDAARVQLVSQDPRSFANPMVRNDTLRQCVRRGRHDGAVVRVVDEMRTTGPWKHASASTVFAISDTEHFLNAKRDEQGHVHTGVHLHFPSIRVNIEQAMYMREALICTLRSAMGDRFAPHGWSEAIPSRAYATAIASCLGVGLRMCGAHKVAACPRCRKRSRDDDLTCTVFGCNKGKVDLGQPFRLRAVHVGVTRDAALETQYRNNFTLLLRKTSVRSHHREPTPTWTLFEGCPRFDVIRRVSDGALYKMKGNETTFKERASYGTTDLVSVDDRSIWRLFEKHIRNRFAKQHAALCVSGVRFSPKRRVYFVHVAGLGQHWCLNLAPPADHDSSTIYFQCDAKGICQRCRCTDTTTDGRHKGSCAKYHSTYKKLGSADAKMLFS